MSRSNDVHEGTLNLQPRWGSCKLPLDITAPTYGREVAAVPFTMTKAAPAIPNCKFPSHVNPRVWLLSSGASPIAIALSRQLLAHGDAVAFGVQASDTSDTSAGRAADFTTFWSQEVLVNEGWKDRTKLVPLDGRCEPALAY